MKKIVLSIAIYLLTNVAIAAGDEWPVFSNKQGADYTLYMLKGIINKFPETSHIDNYTYKIDPHTCELPLNPDDFNESQLVEYKIAEPSESDIHENTANYALFIDDTKIDDSSLIVTRSEFIDIAIMGNCVSTEPDVDILDDTQNENPLPTTKKKKKRTQASHAKKIKKEKKSALQANEALTSSQLINPVHISKQNSTSVVPEFTQIEDVDDQEKTNDTEIITRHNIKKKNKKKKEQSTSALDEYPFVDFTPTNDDLMPLSRSKSVSAPDNFPITNTIERRKSIAPINYTKKEKKKKKDNCSLM